METLLVEAADFMLINISVANDACAYDSRKAAQSETVQLLADRTLMSNVRLYGAQDTLFTGADSNRAYVVNSYINGSCDSIFGMSSLVLDKCEIAITDHITAARSGPASLYLIANSRLVKPVKGQKNYPAAKGRTELGRAWGSGAHVVFKDCWMDSHIATYGWGSSMGGCPATKETCPNVTYAEYDSTGPGADAKARVKWSHQLTAAQAAAVTTESVLRGWDPLVV